MEKLTSEEQKFFDMVSSKSIRKVSMNLSVETLEKIDELANTFKITRTLVIESLMMIGIKPYLDMVESGNKKLQRAHPENKGLQEMASKISKLRSKWKI